MTNQLPEPDSQRPGRDAPHASTATGNPLSFEEALGSLQDTLEELRSDGLNLARALDLYEQGTRLATYCEEVLTTAELRLSQIGVPSGRDPVLQAGPSGKDPEFELEADW